MTDKTDEKRDIQSLYRDALTRIVAILKEDTNILRIILFGSCNSGNADEHSDIDVLIIKKNAEKRFIDRWMSIQKAVREVRENIPFEPIIMTSSEVDDRIALGDHFVSEIIKKGMVLYERK